MFGKSSCQIKKKVPPCENDTESKKNVDLRTANFPKLRATGGREAKCMEESRLKSGIAWENVSQQPFCVMDASSESVCRSRKESTSLSFAVCGQGAMTLLERL